MPRWHHSDSSSERYQEVKSIKTFYAAHISRSQAKSMFGNWTISYVYVTEWPPIGKIAAHSAFNMFSWYKYLIAKLVFPTSVFDVGIFF